MFPVITVEGVAGWWQTAGVDREAWQIRRDYRGIVHIDHFSALGLSRAALRWKVDSGRWRQVLPRVYATFTGRLTEQQRLLAAWLYAGPAAQIGGLTALQLHGVRHLPPAGNQVHLLIPHQQRVRSVGFVRVHRTTRPDRRARANGVLRVCSIARATIDAAIMCRSLPAVRAMFASVVQDGFATVERLGSELDHARRNGSGFARTALGEVSDGVRSAAEAALRATLKRSPLLPPVRWNPTLLAPDGSRLPTPDAWIDEVGLAIEVDSREFHLSPADWERTLDRHNRLARHGAQVLHFPPSQVRRAPAEVLHTVEQTYLERRKAGVRASVKITGN
jgi:hypothetical protein